MSHLNNKSNLRLKAIPCFSLVTVPTCIRMCCSWASMSPCCISRLHGCLPLVWWVNLVSRCGGLLAGLGVAWHGAHHLLILKIIKIICAVSVDRIIQRGWVVLMNVLDACWTVALAQLDVDSLVAWVEMEVESLRYFTNAHWFHWVVEDMAGTVVVLAAVIGCAVISS